MGYSVDYINVNFGAGNKKEILEAATCIYTNTASIQSKGFESPFYVSLQRKCKQIIDNDGIVGKIKVQITDRMLPHLKKMMPNNPCI